MMRRIFLNTGCALLTCLALAGCRTSRAEKEMEKKGTDILEMSEIITQEERIRGGNPSSTSPVVYVYKMKADYSQRVPVLMNEERTRIVSYPAPVDLKQGSEFRLPTPLIEGYWLDNKGISFNTAFLSYTYEEYAALKEAPSMDELMNSILDKYPFEEIHVCGRRADYKDIVSELNKKIKDGFLRK